MLIIVKYTNQLLRCLVLFELVQEVGNVFDRIDRPLLHYLTKCLGNASAEVLA